MPAKTEADHIYLLLSIIEHLDGKPKWDEVAKVTGLYKEGKFVRQAYNSIKTKYSAATPGPSGSATKTESSNVTGDKKADPKTPTKKRGKTDENVISSRKKSKTKVDKPTDEDELAQNEEVEGEVV